MHYSSTLIICSQTRKRFFLTNFLLKKRIDLIKITWPAHFVKSFFGAMKNPHSLVHFSLGQTWLHQKAPHHYIPTQPLVLHSLLSHTASLLSYTASCPTQPLVLHSVLLYTASCPTQPLVLHSVFYSESIDIITCFPDTCTGADGAVWNSSSNNARKCSGAAPVTFPRDGETRHTAVMVLLHGPGISRRRARANVQCQQTTRHCL